MLKDVKRNKNENTLFSLLLRKFQQYVLLQFLEKILVFGKMMI